MWPAVASPLDNFGANCEHRHVARGELVPVLEEFSTPFPGFYRYYPERRHASPALPALVDYLKRKRRDSRAKGRRHK